MVASRARRIKRLLDSEPMGVRGLSRCSHYRAAEVREAIDVLLTAGDIEPGGYGPNGGAFYVLANGQECK